MLGPAAESDDEAHKANDGNVPWVRGGRLVRAIVRHPRAQGPILIAHSSVVACVSARFVGAFRRGRLPLVRGFTNFIADTKVSTVAASSAKVAVAS